MDSGGYPSVLLFLRINYNKNGGIAHPSINFVTPMLIRYCQPSSDQPYTMGYNSKAESIRNFNTQSSQMVNLPEYRFSGNFTI